jgi:hypothetical protein
MGKMRRLRVFTLCALMGSSFLLPVSPAWAGPTKAELSKARAKFQSATELEQAGNYTDALEAFREVGQVKMTPQVRYHIAFCEEKLGRLVTALGGYELAESEAADVGPSFEKEVKARRDDLKARIPKLSVTRGKGAEAAKIEIDGVVLGESSIGSQMTVDPGPHQVSARSPGMNPFSTTIDLAEKDEKTVEVTLEPAESGAALPETGGGSETPEKEKGVEKSPSKVVPFVIGGVGIASLGASGVFFLMKNSAVNDLDAACGASRDQCGPDQQKTYDNAKLYNKISMVTFGVGVVGVGVAATMLILQKPHKEKEKPTARLEVVPTASPTHAGVSLLGAF